MIQAADPAEGLWPDRVRLIALSTFTVGLAVGMLGSLNLHFSPSMFTAGEGAGAAAAGALAGLLPAFSRTRIREARAVACMYVGACGLTSAVSLVVLFVLTPQGFELLPLFLVGMVAGGTWAIAVDLALPVLPGRYGPSVLGLSGVSLGLGGVVASLAAAAAVGASSSYLLLPLAAVVAVILGWAALRARSIWQPTPDAESVVTALAAGADPRRILMTVSLLLQASACAMAAVWQLVYLSRTFGLSLAQGLTVLSGFWLALAAGWSAGCQLPRIRDSVVAMAVPAGLSAAGVVLLHFVGGVWGAVSGTLLLGSGMGVLFQMTLCLADRSCMLWASTAVVRSVRAAPVVALGIGWPVGILSTHWGAGVLLLAVLGCLVAALVGLAVLIVDHRLSGDPVVI